jgi:acylphosphatase
MQELRMQRLSCYFSGRVQGVGFRYTVQNLALQYNVRGYVRNTPGGQVELLMEGPEEQMQGLLDDIRQKMGEFIQEVNVQRSPATGEFERFCIRH